MGAQPLSSLTPKSLPLNFCDLGISPVTAATIIGQYLERSLLLLVTSGSDSPLRTIKCCSVVCGVTSRLLVINTSSSSHANNKCRCLPATSVTNFPQSGTAVCTTHTHRTVDKTRWSQILPTQPAFSALIREVPIRILYSVTFTCWITTFWMALQACREFGFDYEAHHISAVIQQSVQCTVHTAQFDNRCRAKLVIMTSNTLFSSYNALNLN